MKKMFATLAAALALAGCVYKGAKVTEGTDLAVGLTVPGFEGALTLDVLNYLTGFRLGVAENAKLKVKYTYAGTNDYFGCITTRTYKHIDAKVEPCETGATERRARPSRPISPCGPGRTGRICPLRRFSCFPPQRALNERNRE